MTDTPVEYDPYSYEIDADPYPIYRRLRDAAPAYHNERLDFWALSRFDDVEQASMDYRTFTSAKGTVLELMDTKMTGEIIIFMDPPAQTRLRNLVSKAFTPRRIAELEPEVRRIAVEHLEPLAAAGSGDAVKDFTARLPMDVISALLGLPDGDRDDVREWSNATLHREPGRPEPPASALDAHARMWAYFAEQVADRRRSPRDDLISALCTTQLDDERILTFALLLAAAGNETVTKLLASVVYWLWRYPDQRRILIDDPSMIPAAVEEMLRFDPPSHYQGRVLTREVSMHGVTMPAGAKVALITGSTGRDERRFPDPDRFDVRRRFDHHLAFGHGWHICLGASLARLESRVALEEFLRRFPDYEVDEAGIERFHSSNVRGFSGLPISRA
jgi:cytochrome P450